MFIPDKQQDFTDGQFMRAVRPGIKGLAAFYRVRRAGDHDRAAAALVRYFLGRRKPAWSKYRHEWYWYDSPQGTVTARADRLAAGKMAHFRKSGTWDWKDYRRDFSFHMGRRMIHIPMLTAAYDRTGRSKYARALVDILQYQVTRYPFEIDPAFFPDEFRRFSKYHNQLAVPYITFFLIDAVTSPVFRDPAVTDRERFFVYKQLYFYMAQHLRYLGSRYRRDNHFLMERGVAPFIYGVMFPEFRHFGRLLSLGRRMTRRQCDDNILADGAQREHCSAYQYRCLIRFMLPYSVAKVNNAVLFSRPQLERLEKCMEFQFYAARPDGTQTDIGDGRGPDIFRPYTQDAPFFINGRVKWIGRKLGGRDRDVNPFLKARFRTVKPVRPADTSRVYPHGGYAFLRDGWGPDATFMGISALTDSFYNIHLHWDTFGFFLHANGRTLIGEPMAELYGIHQGRTTREQQLSRGFYFGMRSHSTLIVNENTIMPELALGRTWGENGIRCEIRNVHLTDGFDCLCLRHRAYAPVIHNRVVLFIKGGYFIMTDFMNQEIWEHSVFLEDDIRPHLYEQLLQFEFDVPVRVKNGALVAGHPDSAVLVRPAPFKGIKLGITENRLLRIREKGPVYTGTISRERIGPVVFSTVYVPFTGTTAPLKRLTALPVTRNGVPAGDDVAQALELDFGAYKDYYLFARRLGRYAFAGIETASRIYYERRKSGRTVKRYERWPSAGY